ncbi:G patch domain-containing protein [Entamoeba marina]
MKRKTTETRRVINANAKRNSYNQYALDSKGKRMFHGAFEGGNVREYNNVVEPVDDFMPQTFTLSRDKSKKFQGLQLNDIVDDQDGVDYKRKEEEIQKLMDYGMTYVSAEELLESIGWDGNESIHIKKSDKGGFYVSFGYSQPTHFSTQTDKTFKDDSKMNWSLGSSKSQFDKNVARLKASLNHFQIERVFTDTKKQTRYERFLESLACNSSFNPKGIDADQWNKEKEEFVGLALGKILVGKEDKKHRDF